MQKTFHFISGLPRAGSTLLANILAQNPRFGVSATSGILDVIIGIRNGWDTLVEFKAAPNDKGKLNVMRGVLHSYYQDDPHPVVFDKSRGWIGHLELAELLLDRKAKVLVPVRDLREILASFEKLWRENYPMRQLGIEASYYVNCQNAEGRCSVQMRPEQPVGMAITRIGDALLRGFRDRLHFVHFEKLTSNPQQTLREIYEFLGEAPFAHNFDQVEQVTWENDEVHGYKGLHDVRKKVEPVPNRARHLLGAAADAYRGPYLWDAV
jgi:sulfotransferase